MGRSGSTLRLEVVARTEPGIHGVRSENGKQLVFLGQGENEVVARGKKREKREYRIYSRT